MSAEAHHAWLSRFDEAARTADTAGTGELLAPDHVQTDHRPMAWDPVVGRDAMLAWMESLWTMWPDGIAIARELVLAEGEMHVAHEVLTGTAVGGIDVETEWWAVRRIVDGVAHSCDVFGDEAAATAFVAASGARRA